MDKRGSGSGAVKHPPKLDGPYQKRLSQTVEQLRDSFATALKWAKVDDQAQFADKTQSVRDNYMIDVRAANIVRLAESLFTINTEIKDIALTDDFETLNAIVEARKAKLDASHRSTEEQLSSLRGELSAHLLRLETVYFRNLPLLQEHDD